MDVARDARVRWRDARFERKLRKGPSCAIDPAGARRAIHCVRQERLRLAELHRRRTTDAVMKGWMETVHGLGRSNRYVRGFVRTPGRQRRVYRSCFLCKTCSY